MTRSTSFALLSLLAFAAVAPLNAQDGRRYVDPASADGEGLPFSGAVWVGDMLYLSGTIGLDENQGVPSTAEAEARLVLDNIKATLESQGLTMDNLVTVQVFCSDVGHYAAFNSVYRTYFEDTFPARAFIGSGALLFDARFEVQGIASRL